jgi:hypothetical protein
VSLSHLINALWLLEPTMNIAIAVFMYRRRLHTRFPIFFTFQIFHLAYSVLLFVASHLSYRTYFFTFWSIEPLAILLSFANIQELFSAMFRQREGLKDFGTMLFRWAMVVMLLMAVVLATANAGAFERSRFISLVLSLERSVQLMMLGLVMFLLAFSNHLGIQPRHPVFGFVMGWGIVSTGELLLYAERSRASFSPEAFNIMHLCAYNAMLVLWLVYVLTKVPAEVLPNMLLRSQRWNDALLEDPALEEQSTLLIGIETLVERAMSRTSAAGHGNDNGKP